jgi:two-component system sensor histidine kinase RpfC
MSPPRPFPLRAALGGVKSLRQRLSEREDSEHEQSLIRVAIGLLVFGYLFSPGYSVEYGGSGNQVRIAITVFVLFSLGLFLAVLARPKVSPVRRILGMLADLGATSYILAIGGEGSTPLVGLYLWVSMGNGFRYGVDYLIISTALSFFGFGAVLLHNEYWADHTIFAITILILLVVLPGYMGVLLRKLRDAIDRAHEASRAKSQFLANMSHELRTPLHGVIGMTDFLMDTPLSGEQRDISRNIQHSAHTLLGLINDILDIAKIESGVIAIDETDLDLHELVNNTVRMFEHQARNKGLTLVSHIDPAVPFLLRGDPMHLTQVLMNLVGNAVKFTDAGRIEVRVRMLGAQQDQVHIRFEVEDTGIGVPADKQQAIFELFTQADPSLTRRYGGTGLGTTIARQLVELMGGKIGLGSREGAGSLFWVELPLRRRAGDLGLAPPPRGILAASRVLVLAGPELSPRLTETMQLWGIPHETAASTPQAFSLLMQGAASQSPFRVLLVESQAVRLDAEQLVETLRADPSLRNLSLILLDGEHRAPKEQRRLLQAGYSSVLQLPLDTTRLFNAIHAAGTEHDMPENVVPLSEHYRRRGGTERLRILVAEDNETNQLVMRRILERAGHDVCLVDNGEAALDLLQSDPEAFAMGIFDMNMPGLGGLDVIKAYRFLEQGSKRLPMVVLTADATMSARASSLEAGADLYLSKPIDARGLLDAVARLANTTPLRAAPGRPKRVTEEQAPEPGQDPILDEAVLERLTSHESPTGFIDQLVQGFVTDATRNLRGLESSMRENDYPAMRNAAHSLIGTSAEVGARRMVCLCREIERLKPFEMPSDRARQLTAEVQQAFGATRVALQELANRHHGVSS